MINALLFAVYILFTVFGMIFVKLHSNVFLINAGKLSITLHWTFILGLVFYIISFLLWLVLLTKFKATILYPVAFGTSFVFLSILSFYFLKETINLYQIFGFLLILAGVIITVFNSKS